MLFTLAGQEFEDNRVEGEGWQKLKPNTPMGALPILEIDGVMICQSNAISRYIARKFGYGGKTELDQARVDMIVDCLDDMAKPLFAIFSAKTEEEKAAIKTKYQDETAPDYMEKLQNILKQNKGGDGWFVGDDITWADVQYMGYMEFLDTTMKLELKLDKFEKLKALKQKTESHPKIQEWISKRPQ